MEPKEETVPTGNKHDHPIQFVNVFSISRKGMILSICALIAAAIFCSVTFILHGSFIILICMEVGLSTILPILFIKLGNRKTLFFVGAILFYLLAIIVFISRRGFERVDLISLVLLLLPGIASIVFLYLFFQFELSTSISINKITDIAEINVNKIVADLFDTPEFLTALRTTLPKGETDEAYGLDFIPFMLQSIDERRKRFEKSSRRFLALTVAMGIVFSSILIAFGYILVNEAAAGLPRTLVHIEDATSGINTNLARLVDQRLRDILEEASYRGFLSFPTELKSDPILIDIQNSLSTAYRVNNSVDMQQTLEQGIQKLSDDKYKQVRESLEKIRQPLAAFTEERQRRFNQIEADLAKLNTFQANAENKLEATNYRASEILKRLAIGLIVTSFFLAILRYVGGLYKDHYNQVLIAEQDDLAIRRFYVAFKCAKENSEATKAVITQFMSNAKNPNNGDSSKDNAQSENNSKLIEDIVAALTKKI